MHYPLDLRLSYAYYDFMSSALLSNLPSDLQQYLNSARELTRQHSPSATSSALVPTTIDGLDELLTGGLSRGQMIELVGHRSSGRFSTVLSLLTTTTNAGEAVALIDLGNNLDPQQAALCGVDLLRLLWIRPRRLKDVLASAEALLAGGFPLVVVDLGTPPVPGGRGGEASWLRLARAALSHEAIVFVSSPYRVSGTAATGVFKATQGRPLWTSQRQTPQLLTGLKSELSLEKLRGHYSSRSSTLRLATHEALTFGMVS